MNVTHLCIFTIASYAFATLSEMNGSQHPPGLAQWFRVGECDAVERTVEAIHDLGIREFRTLCSWADWDTPEGPEWFDHYLHALGKTGARLVLNPFYTPDTYAIPTANGTYLTSSPPSDIGAYISFLEELIHRYGAYADWIQVWNEPNWKPYWEWDLDPQWRIFAELATQSAKAIHRGGKRAALGGLSPYEPEWITRMHECGALEHIDAVGIHYTPNWSGDRRRWFGWDTEIASARAHLHGLGSAAEFWISEVGYATIWGTDQEREKEYQKQIEYFEMIRHLPVDKIFWFSLFDQAPDHPTDDALTMGTEVEQAAYHFGLITTEGGHKPLYHHWRNTVRNNKVA